MIERYDVNDLAAIERNDHPHRDTVGPGPRHVRLGVSAPTGEREPAWQTFVDGALHASREILGRDRPHRRRALQSPFIGVVVEIDVAVIERRSERHCRNVLPIGVFVAAKSHEIGRRLDQSAANEGRNRHRLIGT